MELKYEEFKAWLEKQPPDRTYRTVDACKCPLGTYLNEVFTPPIRGAVWSIGCLTYGFPRRGGDDLNTPGWADAFILRVDTADFLDRTISTTQALQILDGVI